MDGFDTIDAASLNGACCADIENGCGSAIDNTGDDGTLPVSEPAECRTEADSVSTLSAGGVMEYGGGGAISIEGVTAACDDTSFSRGACKRACDSAKASSALLIAACCEGEAYEEEA